MKIIITIHQNLRKTELLVLKTGILGCEMACSNKKSTMESENKPLFLAAGQSLEGLSCPFSNYYIDMLY